jgi:Putative ATP-dependent Lon protease
VATSGSHDERPRIEQSTVAKQGSLDLSGIDDDHFFHEAESRIIDALHAFADNLVELGPRGTGKSYVVQEVSPYTALLTGGTTVANRRAATRDYFREGAMYVHSDHTPHDPSP